MTPFFDSLSFLSEAQVAVEQLALAERETKTLQIQMSEKETELAEALRKVKTYEENLHEKQRELVSLRSELHLTSKDKREMMEDFRAQLTAEFAEKTNDMEKALEEKTAEVTALKTQVEGLESEVSQAKEEVKTLEENNKSFLITVNTLQGLVPPHPHFHFFVANLPIFDPCTDKTFPFSRRRLKLAAREGLTRPSPMRSQRSWSLLPVSCFSSSSFLFQVVTRPFISSDLQKEFSPFKRKSLSFRRLSRRRSSTWRPRRRGARSRP